jgi:hypothetical protein
VIPKPFFLHSGHLAMAGSIPESGHLEGGHVSARGVVECNGHPSSLKSVQSFLHFTNKTYLTNVDSI